jgi:hypothetical protein
MGIDKLFGAVHSKYLVDCFDLGSSDDLVRSLIMDHLNEQPENGIVWAFYGAGPFELIRIRDGVRLSTKNDLSVSRTYGKRDGFFSRNLVVPANEYLEGVKSVYLQLCGLDEIRAGGIEITSEGLEIGHYDFSRPLV